MKFKMILAMALLIALSSCDPAMNQIPDDISLRQAADNRGLIMGTAIEPWHTNDSQYKDALNSSFNAFTAENRMKWDALRPSQTTYSFSNADSLIDYAEEHNMKVRGHALVWHSQNPSWLQNGTWTESELREIMKDHISTVAGRYAGKLYAWDVVNEALDGGGYRTGESSTPSLWYETYGSSDFIVEAFKEARKADPDALLYYNDYSIAQINDKSDFLYQEVQKWMDAGAPIDGIGFQSHHILGDINFNSIRNNVKRFNDLGLKVDFTEVDIRIDGSDGFSEREYREQAAAYAELLEIILEDEKNDVFTIWGVDDGHSWIPGFFTGFGDALIFDEDYQAKPAYHALVDVLK